MSIEYEPSTVEGVIKRIAEEVLPAFHTLDELTDPNSKRGRAAMMRQVKYLADTFTGVDQHSRVYSRYRAPRSVPLRFLQSAYDDFARRAEEASSQPVSGVEHIEIELGVRSTSLAIARHPEQVAA